MDACSDYASSPPHVDCFHLHSPAVAALIQGGLSINYSDNYYLLSQRHDEVPRLTQQHHEAMALFNKVASSDALRMDAMLQPGDVQLLNNHTQLHTRERFEDFPVSCHTKLKAGSPLQHHLSQ